MGFLFFPYRCCDLMRSINIPLTLRISQSEFTLI
jgi:hypothetical protein